MPGLRSSAPERIDAVTAVKGPICMIVRAGALPPDLWQLRISTRPHFMEDFILGQAISILHSIAKILDVFVKNGDG